MIPLCRDATRCESILIYWNKSMPTWNVKTTIMHWHHVHKVVEFDEIAQADELSFCVRLLWNIHYETILPRHLLQPFSIFNTSKRPHASLYPGKARSYKQPLRKLIKMRFFTINQIYCMTFLLRITQILRIPESYLENIGNETNCVPRKSFLTCAFYWQWRHSPGVTFIDVLFSLCQHTFQLFNLNKQ
jgi:hypothetical protein